MHNADHEALIATWLDDRLTPQQRETFERLCVEDKEFAAMVATANRFSMGAEQFERMPVPHWDKEATFSAPQKTHWWQWQGLPAMSLAMSFMAIVLVVSGFKVEVSEGQIAMGFQQGPSETELEELVNERLQAYQQTNQTLITQYLDALNTQQQENSAQLTQYLLSSSRQERREDFAELVKFINQQRTDDQRFVARQINHLQQEISAISGDYPVANPPMELNDE